MLTNSVSGAAADPAHQSDEGRVRQILLNPLTHAIRFTEADGHVTIRSDTGETVTGAAFAGPGPWIHARVED